MNLTSIDEIIWIKTWPHLTSTQSWPIGLSNEEIYFDLIQFINDSVGMSIATSAIAFYIPVGIMCTLYSQVIRDPSWPFVTLKFTKDQILRCIWHSRNGQKFYNLWMANKKSWNKTFFQHNVIGKKYDIWTACKMILYTHWKLNCLQLLATASDWFHPT